MTNEEQRNEELQRLIAKANARYQAMSPQQQEDMWYEQRRSFVRGSCPSNFDYDEWCKNVDRILPPRPAQ